MSQNTSYGLCCVLAREVIKDVCSSSEHVSISDAAKTLQQLAKNFEIIMPLQTAAGFLIENGWEKAQKEK